MEKRKSIINILSSVFASLINIVITLLAQHIFLQILNIEFLGINSLFSNIISLLGVFELGIGTAIVFSLYKPLSEKNQELVGSLMHFYKKAYRIVALVVAMVGFSITPFLPFFIKEVTVDINIYVVYILFVINTVSTYLLSYRRSILYADCKNYQISFVHIIYIIATNVLQLTLLAITKSYYLYLVAKLVMQVVENLILSKLAAIQYPYLSNAYSKLNKTYERSIFKKIRALFLHKIGGFVVLGTDNILISKFIGLVEVGLYSNYYIIINALYTIIGQAFSAFTPNIGHMLITEEAKQSYTTFQRIRLINSWVSSIAAIGFLTLAQPVITVWLGGEYLLGISTVIVLSFNIFQRLQRYPYNTFKEAAGVFHEDRFVPIVESLTNIIASLIFLHFFGITGVFIGTAISDLVLWIFSFPKFVYKKIFQRSYLNYIKETTGYILVFIAAGFITFQLCNLAHFDSIIAQLLYNCIVVMTVPNIIMLIIFRKTDSFKYFYNYSIKIIKQRRTRQPKNKTT